MGERQLPCPRARYRRVEPGDTFYEIARELGVSVEEVQALNPDVDPDALRVGSLICVPFEAGIPVGRVPPCESGLYWVIAPGDTMFGIARSLGIPLETLLELNPGADPLNLIPGDSLCLPGTGRS